MPKRNVNLTPDLEDFVLTRVESGRYANVSELVQAALHALHREERMRDSTRKPRHAADRDHAGTIAEADEFRMLWQAHQTHHKRPLTDMRQS
jgi:antitoxin ParD1/3/4